MAVGYFFCQIATAILEISHQTAKARFREARRTVAGPFRIESERDLRKAVFGKMVIMENMSRGVIRPFGLKVGQVSTDRFEARVGELVAELAELAQIVEPLLAARAAMRLQFDRMHHMALAAARKDELVWREDVLQHSGAFHSALVSA